MFVTYCLTSVVTTKYLLKNGELFNIGLTFGQAAIIGVGILMFTVVFNMIRAYRICNISTTTSTRGTTTTTTTVPTTTKVYGVTSGFQLGILATILGLTTFIFLNMSTIWLNVLTIILPFLSNYVEVAKALVVALISLGGYGFGRIYIGLC